MLIPSCFSQSKEKESAILESGVSEQLAQFRKKQISDVQYNLSFEIPNQKEENINAHLIVNLNLTDLSQPLLLDFKEKTLNIK